MALGSRSPDSPSRVGLAVRSRSKAVTRNRIKRRLRAALREFPVPPGFDLVVRAGDEVQDTGFADLVGDLEAATRAATGAGRESA